MSKEIGQIISLIGCTEDEANTAFTKYKDVVLAVDSLMTVPTTSGNKYIPPKPEINTMMTTEQKERCDRGRQVCDTINACRKSAYHSAKQQADLAAEAQQKVSVVQLEDAHYEPTT